MKISSLVCIVITLLLAACSFTATAEVTTFPPTPLPTLQGTLVSTRIRDVHPIASPSPTVEPTQAVFDCSNDSTNVMTTYKVDAEMQYAKRELKVAQDIAYTNQTSIPLPSLVLNVKPNWQSGVFSLQSAELSNGTSVKTHLGNQKLEITLPQSLEPNCTVRFSLKFNLRVPAIDIGGPNAYQGYLGYDDKQTNLGEWLPVVALHDGNEWISHEESPIGEQEALDIANWDVTLRITNAPNTIQVAAPGIGERINDGEWHFTLPASRDFSLSIGENYRLLQQTTNSGVNVEVYTFPDAIISSDTGKVDTAAYALNTAIKSVNLYESLYGAYPLKRLVIVEGDFPDGMEFSGIVFVGGEYFRGLNGVQSYLTLITAHEIVHQWWYARVGNDQAITPWLDEALATYSEVVFIEKYYPELKDWWWDFRVKRLHPEGYVDSSVYDFTTRRAYINSVYLRGVLMLNDIRTVLGDEVFFGWLNRYAAEGSGRVMTSDEFWNLLTPDQLARTDSIRKLYLHKQPTLITPMPAS